MTRRKLDQKKVEEKREENKLKAFFMDNKKIVKYSLIGLLAISLSAGAISLALRNDNKNKGKVTIESSKESKNENQKETNKETQIEVSKEIEEEINKEIEEEIKKIEDKGLSKEDQEKEIQKAKENILASVSKKEKLDKNSLENIVNKKVSKRVESSTKINNELKEKARETRKESEKKITDTNTSQTKENKETKPSKPSKPKDQSKKNITYKYEDKETIIPYKTRRKHNIPNAKTRVKQKGVNGKTINTYKITLEDGKEVSRNISDTKTIKAQDEIIETYVKVQDKKVETREVEDKSRPIYEEKGRDRWFVRIEDTGKIHYYYSAKDAAEASDKFLNEGYLNNWGTADPEVIKTDKIIGYHTKTENVVVQEEKWAWQ